MQLLPQLREDEEIDEEVLDEHRDEEVGKSVAEQNQAKGGVFGQDQFEPLDELWEWSDREISRERAQQDERC